MTYRSVGTVKYSSITDSNPSIVAQIRKKTGKNWARHAWIRIRRYKMYPGQG